MQGKERVQTSPCSEEDGIAMLLLLHRDDEIHKRGQAKKNKAGERGADYETDSTKDGENFWDLIKHGFTWRYK
jgi:hypothetical protein